MIPKGEASERQLDERQLRAEAVGADEDEDEGSRDTNAALPNKPNDSQKKSRFAQILSETSSIMYKPWFLLTVDSLADGMVSYALTNHYLDRKPKWRNLRSET
ncbi:MAG: hypothetical protein LQ340_006612, partial [Diploschistes diacapsis]